jgi:hypothetical protein
MLVILRLNDQIIINKVNVVLCIIIFNENVSRSIICFFHFNNKLLLPIKRKLFNLIEINQPKFVVQF